MNNPSIYIKENPEWVKAGEKGITDWLCSPDAYEIIAVGPPPGLLGQLEFPFVIEVEMQNE